MSRGSWLFVPTPPGFKRHNLSDFYYLSVWLKLPRPPTQREERREQRSAKAQKAALSFHGFALMLEEHEILAG